MRDSEPRNRNRNGDGTDTVAGTDTGDAFVPVPGSVTVPSPSELPVMLPFWERTWGRIGFKTQCGIGSVLRWLGVPGAIADMSYDDPITGQRISVVVETLGARIVVGHSHYTFSRLSGKFTGTGYSLCATCSCATHSED